MPPDPSALRSAPRHEDDAAAPGPARWPQRETVLAGAVALIAAQLALRFWMLWPSWFYEDDYALVGQAHDDGSSPADLVTPYAGQFMPLGRAIAGVVGGSGQLDWGAAALSTLAMVAVANAACLWMLLELFGRRPAVLLPLTLYLTSAIVVPATMWWAAALNQLPLQAVMFAAVAAWVRYLREGATRWWVVTALVVGVGFLAYVKTLFVLVVLAWLALAHFSRGSLRERLVDAWRRHLAPVLVLGLGSAAFLVYFTQKVPSIVVTGERRTQLAVDLAETMLGQALPTGLLGGPWRWDSQNAPASFADPPDGAVLLAWVVLVGVALALVNARVRVGRVLALLGVYAVLDFYLLLSTRAELAGGLAGLEYRYLTDLLPVAVLCLGLATTTVRDCPEPTEPRPGSTLAERLPRRTLAVSCALLAVSGLVSSVAYARVWHTDNNSRDWFDQVSDDLGRRGSVELFDANAPEGVVSGFVLPWNRLSRLLPRAGLDVTFPQVSSRLLVLDDAGAPHAPFVDPQIRGLPGPEEGCGWRVGPSADPVTIPFERSVPGGIYWLRIGMLTSEATTVRVQAGQTEGTAQVSQGLVSVYVDVTRGADDVVVSVEDGATVCVGDLQAGPVSLGAYA